MAFEFLYNGFATGGGGGGGGAEGATAVALNSVGATIVQNLPSTYNSINNTITVYYDGASATIAQKGMVTTATQSFAGAKTFTSALAVSAASSQLVLGSTANTTTFNSPTSLTATRTVTLPDANSNTVRPLGSATAGSVVSFIDSTGLQTLTNTITNATTATNATNVATTQVSNNATYYPILAPASTNSNQAMDLSTTYTYNPSTGNLVVPNGGSTGSTANGVTYNAVGNSWIASTLPAVSANWENAAYGNGVWVAIQFGSAVAAYSIDNGKTWVQSAMPSAANWISVTYGGGKFVAVAFNSSSGAISYAGITWVAVTLASSSGWYWVTYGLVGGVGYFVAVSQTSGTVAQYSLDGVNWTASTLPATASWISVGYGVISGTPYFIAVSTTTATAYSTNGTTWTAGGALPSSMSASSVAFGLIGTTPYFVIGGNNGTNSVAYSTNGTTWTQGTIAARCDYITYGKGVFVGVNSNGSTSYYSTNGIAFTASATTVTARSGPIVYGGNVFVALPFTSSATAMYGFYITEAQVTNKTGNNQIVTYDDLYNSVSLPSSVLNFQTYGRFLPALSGWTNVGSPTITAEWIRTANEVRVTINIVPGTSISTTAVTSTITGLPFAVAVDFSSSLNVINATVLTSLGNALALKNTTTIQMPAISVTGDTIIISGTYTLV